MLQRLNVVGFYPASAAATDHAHTQSSDCPAAACGGDYTRHSGATHCPPWAAYSTESYIVTDGDGHTDGLYSIIVLRSLSVLIGQSQRSTKKPAVAYCIIR